MQVQDNWHMQMCQVYLLARGGEGLSIQGEAEPDW